MVRSFRSVPSLATALVVGLLASFQAVATPAATPSFTSLFVFGDSLSDAAGGSNDNPFAPNEGGLLIPGPYDGGRVSNGPVAAEYLGGYLGLSAAQQFHFAIAGARSGLTGASGPTGLQTQIGAFAMGGANPAYGGGLFMVWAGANDLRDAFDDAFTNNTDPTTAFGGIIDNLELAVSNLHALGARSFLLPTMPDIGLTPEVLANGPVASGTVSSLTMLFNSQLTSAFGALEGTLAGAHFTTFNTFAAHRALVAGAPDNGYLNLTNGCLIPVPGAAQAQSPCSESFFVDNIHPTTSVHQTLAMGMAAAVPEPATMLMMGLGVLALLGASRRRQA